MSNKSESSPQTPHFGDNNALLRETMSDEEYEAATRSDIFGEVPADLVEDTDSYEHTVFDQDPVNPFQAHDDAVGMDGGVISTRQRGGKKRDKRGRAVQGRKKKPSGSSKAGGKNGKGGDEAEKKRGGIIGFFTTPAEKNNRGKGLSYTRHNSMPMVIAALMALSFVLSALALAVAASKMSPSAVKPVVDKAFKQSGGDFPKGAAVQWAGQVVRVWGTWDEKSQGTHQTYLAPFLGSGMDAQGGWNGKGTQSVEFVSMNPDPQVTDENRALVSGAYQIQDGSWRCVTVPVYAYHANGTSGASQWAFALAANPAPSPCAPRTGVPTAPNYTLGKGLSEDDQVNQDLQTKFFPGFMAAWGSSDTNGMAQYAVPGVQMSGLGGAVATSPQPTISDVHLFYTGDTVQQDTTYKAVVTVNWSLDGSDASIAATYIVPLKKTGDRWYATGEPQAVSQGADAQGGDPAGVNAPGDDAKPGGYATSKTTPKSAPATVTPGASPSPSPSASGSPSASASPSPSASSGN